jgi:hypothetical protein
VQYFLQQLRRARLSAFYVAKQLSFKVLDQQTLTYQQEIIIAGDFGILNYRKFRPL